MIYTISANDGLRNALKAYRDYVLELSRDNYPSPMYAPKRTKVKKYRRK